MSFDSIKLAPGISTPGAFFFVFMDLGILKPDFEKWASKRMPFNFNRHTKELIMYGKCFDEIIEPLQLAVLTQFLDERNVWIIVSPVDGPEWWSYKILMPDIMAPFFIAYQLPTGDESLTSRFLATQAAVKKAIELLNEGGQNG